MMNFQALYREKFVVMEHSKRAGCVIIIRCQSRSTTNLVRKRRISKKLMHSVRPQLKSTCKKSASVIK